MQTIDNVKYVPVRGCLWFDTGFHYFNFIRIFFLELEDVENGFNAIKLETILRYANCLYELKIVKQNLYLQVWTSFVLGFVDKENIVSHEM